VRDYPLSAAIRQYGKLVGFRVELKKGSFELKKQGSFRNSCGLIAHLKESWGKMESVETCASLAFAQIQTCDGMIASPSSLLVS
jgi:hypothetical protein